MKPVNSGPWVEGYDSRGDCTPQVQDHIFMMILGDRTHQTRRLSPQLVDELRWQQRVCGMGHVLIEK